VDGTLREVLNTACIEYGHAEARVYDIKAVGVKMITEPAIV